MAFALFPVMKLALGLEEALLSGLAFLVIGALLVFSDGPGRMRGLRIELHARGVVLVRKRSRRIVLFDDVDEVWIALSYYTASAVVDALTLVDRRGARHRLPMHVTDGLPMWNWIAESCSASLLPEARRALSAGELLTFARVRFDRETIAFGDTEVKWSELRGVRFLPGRIAFLRGQSVFPWRTVKLDAVPHPTIFVKLVKECAGKSGETAW